MATATVRYVGIADERTISKADLRGVGVEYDGPPLRWDRKNRFAVRDVPMDDMLEDVLKAEGHFTIEVNNDAGEAREVAGADDPGTEGDVIVDGDTGAKSATKRGKAAGNG